jgi:2-dehydro-3-deoxyphosphogluconate aldolase / (4S)-4-hydroxy-2-oxoglutarate aldolase
VARFSRLDTVLITLRTGLIPVVPTADASTTIGIVDALADGGVRVVELTNRGDGAVEVFAAVEAHCRARRPDVIVGIGSVFDAGTASQYLNLGASFVVSPFLVDDVAVTCNRRMTAYMPGAATPGEVMRAEELGAEIVKVFPARTLGPSFVADVLAPCPWSRLMPTGGIAPTREAMTPWLEAGAACLGLGSQLVPSAEVAASRWEDLSARAGAAIELIEQCRPPSTEAWADDLAERRP